MAEEIVAHLADKASSGGDALLLTGGRRFVVLAEGHRGLAAAEHRS